MSDILPNGKLPHDFLDELLKRYTITDESVVEGPATGIDSALLRSERQLIFVKTDPVTFVTEDLGSYIVNINANDLAAMGGEPRWFLVTLLFPAGVTTRGEVETAFSGIHEACDELSVAFCGGHTEITDAVTRVVASGTMLGESMTDRTFPVSYARANDSLILTKGIAVEGTSIIAREKRQEVFEKWGWEFLAGCIDFLKNPGISVLPEARAASRVHGVHAMHDLTEGGLSAALHELADASGNGFVVETESIHIFRETDALCKKYGIDPLGLIASGSLLIAVEGEHEGELLETISSEGIRANVIGKLVDNSTWRKITTVEGEVDLKRYESDEILKL
jgi:hydrogenase maturation factor